MITYKDIRISINKRLALTGIEINSTDVQEGFIRPSFFVQLDNVERSGDEHQVHKSMTIRIYYFPSDRHDYAIEILDMQETLENLFDLKLLVRDRLLNVNEFNISIDDGVLNCSFDIEFYDGRRLNENGQTIVDEMIKDKEIPGEPVENPDVPGEIPETPENPEVPEKKPETGKEFYEKHPIEKMEYLDYEKE